LQCYDKIGKLLLVKKMNVQRHDDE